MRSLSIILLVAPFALGCGATPEPAETGPLEDTSDLGSDLPAADVPVADVGDDLVHTDDLPIASDAVDSRDDVEVVDGPDADPSDAEVVDAEPDAEVDAVEPGDVGPRECTPGSAATDFGLSIAIDLERCVFSQAELRGGVELPYEVLIRASDAQVWSRPLDAGGCATPGDSGIAIQERVQGGDESWCICDEGLCMAPEPTFSLLTPGTYADSIEWDGRNWFGPSDFGNPPGEAFPPGEYLFVVRGAGTIRRADGSTSEWDISATAPIVVVE